MHGGDMEGYAWHSGVEGRSLLGAPAPSLMDCQGAATAMTITSGNVVISNVVFVNCAANAVVVSGTAATGSVAFINCTW